METDWHLSTEAPRATDGAIIRRWSYSRYDVEAELEHTEDRFEVVLDGEVIAEEHHARSPATRSYSQQQAADLYARNGLEQVRLWKEFTTEPAGETDRLFTGIGVRPGP